MEQTTYKQLSLMAEAEMTTEQREFILVHKSIVRAGQRVAEELVEMANDLKRMKEGCLYKAAGFEEFKDYVETALGIKERQAYNFIKITELAPEYLTANASAGVTKLAMIASASEVVKTELMSDGETLNQSVRELKATIKELEDKNSDQQQQIEMLEKAVDEYEENDLSLDLSNAEERNNELAAMLSEKEQAFEEQKSKVAELEAKVKELEENPIKVVEKVTEQVEVQVENPETAQKLKEAKAKLKEEKEKAEEAQRLANEARANAESSARMLEEYKAVQESQSAFKMSLETIMDLYENKVVDALLRTKRVSTERATVMARKLEEFAKTIIEDVKDLVEVEV